MTGSLWIRGVRRARSVLALTRAVCGSTALFWSGRPCVLPWLGVRPTLTTPLLRLGYELLVTECVTYATASGWLALRTT